VALNQDIAILRQVPLFAVLDAEALRLVAFSAESRVYRAGDVLFQRGDASDGGYVVLSGSVALDSRDDGSPDGYVVGPGVLIGELALVVETERPATAVVREAASLMKVTRRVFRRVLEEFPDAAVTLRAMVLDRLQKTSGRLGSIRHMMLAIDNDPLRRRD
jgi:CRP-like cAMP-binding protein